MDLSEPATDGDAIRGRWPEHVSCAVRSGVGTFAILYVCSTSVRATAG